MISVSNLVKIYQNGATVYALNGVSFYVEGGKFVAITGPSGSGKTTLLNMLGALDTPTSGKVQVKGVDISSLDENQLAQFRRKYIGFVFQLFNLIPHLTALDNVMVPLIPYKRKLDFKLDERAKVLLDSVGLSEKQQTLPIHLSGGEQQRVAIARALINYPKIILADEPTGNLDSETSAEILNLLMNLRQSLGMTLILVTHNLDIATKADWAIQLLDGRIQFDPQLKSAS